MKWKGISFALVHALFLIVFSFVTQSICASLIDLNSSNFEHLTELGSDGNTGDWLLSFCIPRAKSCQQLDRILRRVDRGLGGVVTVARLDMNSNRELARRFGVTEFPTLVYVSRAQAFKYSGRFSVDAISEFVNEGYNLEPPQDISPKLSVLDEIYIIFQHAFSRAHSDVLKGNFASMSLVLSTLPVLFVVIVMAIVLAPLPISRYDAEFIRHREDIERFKLLKKTDRKNSAGRSSLS